MDRTALPPGARLGEFEIVRVLASGGFGIVYLARDLSLDREVAVKEFMPSFLAGRSDGQRVSVRSTSDAQTYALGLQSFIDEAKLLARLSHPAIVKVYRFWKGNGTGYMVMPYLRGPTLGDVRRSMSVPPTEAWLQRMTGPLLDALAVLHAEGFYHRDIAPDNVLIGDNGLPVLLDFGAARRVIANRSQSVTAIVKPHFAPIEQYAEARLLKQGPWTDLYALGALMSYLLEGVPPPASTARAVHDDRVPLASRHIPRVSTAFLAAIDWALAVKPQDRPQSVAELRSALDGRIVAPARARSPSASSRAGRGSDDSAESWTTDSPFPATRKLARGDRGDIGPPVAAPALPKRGLASSRVAIAARGLGPRARAWSAVAAVSAFALLFLAAWPVADGPGASHGAAIAQADAAPSSSTTAPPASSAAPQASVPVAASVIVPVVTPAAPASGAILASLPSSSAPSEVIEGPAEKIIERTEAPGPAESLASAMAATRPETAEPSRVSARTSKHAAARRHAPERKLARATTRSPGPVELCASRNFFMRPWCVQRRCEEPRFKNSSQCVPHQVARSAY
jgi:serine/threonine protein kinase